MKHSLKSIIALLLCVVMLLTTILTSCNSGDSGGDGDQGTSQGTPSDNAGDNSSQNKPSDSKPDGDGNSDEDNQTNNNGGGNEDTTVQATGVTLNKTTLSLIKGDSETLTATVAPADTTDKTLTWTTSNASVATVANGTVTAVGAGTATITVTTANGKTATCEVTVSVLASGVSLNKNNLSLIKGGSETLTSTVSPADTTDKTLTWTTSNASVATVANGTVTAVGAGTATITVTDANGNTDTCEVTVSVLASGVSLNKNNLSLIKGGSETLTATVAPADTTDKTLTWTTSNASVATVANGTVTAVGAGIATITVTTANGKTATCEVTVSVLASGVSLNKNNLSLIKGGSETLIATIAPANTTDKTLTWTTSNANVATVANGIVTAVGEGVATITVRTVSGKTDVCYVTVDFIPAYAFYMVEHYLENEYGEYDLKDVDYLEGINGTEVTPDTKKYEGFVAPIKQSIVVSDNDVLIVKYYYTRNAKNTYSVTFVTNGGSNIPTQALKPQSSLPDVKREGFTFGGWFSEATLLNKVTVMPANDIILYAYWEEENKPSDFKYYIDPDTDAAVIYKYLVDSSYENKVVCIPEYIEGKPVTVIRSFAFENSYVTNITVPTTVKTIGFSAFKGCEYLYSLTLPCAQTNLNETNDAHLGYFFGNDGYSYNNLVVPSSLSIVTITGGTDIDASFFRYCSSIESIIINDGVIRIGERAFDHCSSLTNIQIPPSITNIGPYAFEGCGFTELVIPDSVTSIGFGAFAHCYLKSITIPFVGKGKDAKLLDETCFGYIFGATLEDQYDEDVIPSSIKTVIITGGSSIDSYAFRSCKSITKIVIPKTVTFIGSYAFKYCTFIARVYYMGTFEEWDEIVINFNNSDLTDKRRYYYSDTQPTDTAYDYWHYVNGVPTPWKKN